MTDLIKIVHCSNIKILLKHCIAYSFATSNILPTFTWDFLLLSLKPNLQTFLHCIIIIYHKHSKTLGNLRDMIIVEKLPLENFNLLG